MKVKTASLAITKIIIITNKQFNLKSLQKIFDCLNLIFIIVNFLNKNYYLFNYFLFGFCQSKKVLIILL